MDLRSTWKPDKEQVVAKNGIVAITKPILGNKIRYKINYIIKTIN